MKITISCASGAEASVKREMERLGYGVLPAIDGKISLEGSFKDVARLNVFLRCAERVMICLGSFHAETFDELFFGASQLPFEEFLSPHSLIRLDGNSYQSRLGAIKACGGVLKKAIVERLKNKLKVQTLDERGERAIVRFFLVKDVLNVYLDTSGDGLHKRGYRAKTWEAPLRETTAAAMIESSFFKSGRILADIFCGSGTIPIEAALYAQNIAPGNGRDFDFLHWKNTPKVMDGVKKEAEELQKRSSEGTKIFASDIDRNALELARFHARRAGVENLIQFETRDMRAFSSDEKYGIMMCNPPYGVRVGKGDDLYALYCDFGKMYSRLKSWSCVFISGYEDALKAFHHAPDKIKKVTNANIPCNIYSFYGEKPAPSPQFAQKIISS